MDSIRRSASWLVFLALGIGFAAAAQPAPSEESAADRKAAKALVRKGAREWSAYCGSCHNARPPGERSPAEWDTIMMHMRVRANLPARDAEALLAFLRSR